MEKIKFISGILILEKNIIELNTGFYVRILTIEELQTLKEKVDTTLANYRYNNLNEEQIKKHNLRKSYLACNKK